MKETPPKLGQRAGSGTFTRVMTPHKCNPPNPYQYSITGGTQWTCDCGDVRTLKISTDNSQGRFEEIKQWKRQSGWGD